MSEATSRLLLGPRSMRIEQFRFGEVVIDGDRYADDLIVFEDRVRAGWRRTTGHVLQLDDLAEALACELEALIIGTGTQQCLKVAPEVIAHTMKAGIELLVFDTRTACQTFNHLCGKRRIVAALHLTC
jgi:hypothetical protein